MKTTKRNGQKIGMISGHAQVRFNMPSQPVEYDPSADPADTYARYVGEQVRHIMNCTGEVPTEITVGLAFDEE